MAAVLPLVIAATVVTAAVIGRNIEEISPTAADAFGSAADTVSDAASDVVTGLQNQIRDDAELLDDDDDAQQLPDTAAQQADDRAAQQADDRAAEQQDRVQNPSAVPPAEYDDSFDNGYDDGYDENDYYDDDGYGRDYNYDGGAQRGHALTALALAAVTLACAVIAA